MEPLWHCTPRHSKLSERACGLVHERALKKPFGATDRTCGACPGVRARYELGLEKPPTDPPEMVVRMVEKREFANFGYSRVVATKHVEHKPRPECKTEGCTMQAAPKRAHCSTSCYGRHVETTRAVCRLEGCTERSMPRSQYCSREHRIRRKSIRRSATLARKRAAEPVPVADCQRCGKSYPLTYPLRKYCSAYCRKSRGMARKLEAERACKTCGAAFAPSSPQNAYCSINCRKTLYNESRRVVR